MNDLIERITNAIIRQEGMSPTYSNPMNLRAAPWRVGPLIAGGFWRPATRAEGIAGGAHVVALHVAEGNTLTELISGWAPPIENNTAAYIAHVKEWANIPDENQPLWSYLGV